VAAATAAAVQVVAMEVQALPASAPQATALAARGEEAAGEAVITDIMRITAMEGHSAPASGIMMTTMTIPITAIGRGNIVTGAITAVINMLVTIIGAIDGVRCGGT
jgi:hypothetical protein